MKKLAALAIIMIGIGLLSAFFVFGEEDLVKFKGEPYTDTKIVEASSIKSLQIETDTFDVTFLKGTSQDIKINLEGNVTKKLKDKIIFNTDTNGETLHIVAKSKDSFTVGISIMTLKVNVELPEKLWNQVDIDTDTGNISIDQMEGEQLKLSSDTGDLKIANYRFNNINFETDTGNSTFTDGEGIIKGESDTGNIRIESDQIRNDVSLESDTGNIAIELDKQPESAAIVIKKDTGKTTIDWTELKVGKESGNSVERILGSGDIKINLESNTGNFKLGLR